MTAASRFPSPPFWIAHRGDSTRFPENTLRAVKEAFKLGCAVVEIDLQVSLDHELVVSHDADLQRTGGQGVVIAQSTWPELRKQSVGYAEKFGSAFTQETLPSLDEVLRAAQLADGRLMIEVKASGVGAAVARLLCTRAATRRHIIASFDEQVLIDARSEIPSSLLQLLVDQPVLADVQRAVELGACVFGCNQKHVSSAVIEAAHQAGLQVWTYTVNDLQRAKELARMSVDGLTSDRVRDLREELRSDP